MSKIFAYNQNGYTLLFSVVVASIVLAIATFILSISRKQFILSSAARDSTVAIYAADGGIECAVNNLSSGLSTTSWYGILPACGVNPAPNPTPVGWAVSTSNDPNGAIATTSFYMPASTDGNGNATTQACVWVQVGQWYNGTVLNTIVESRGYNMGWNATTKDCSNFSPRKVERALRLHE